MGVWLRSKQRILVSVVLNANNNYNQIVKIPSSSIEINFLSSLTLFTVLLAARQQSGMTQEAVALKIGTSKSAISRLESGNKHTPSVATLRKYADAVGCELEIKLTPKKEQQTS